MPGVSPEQIAQAREIDLLSYLQSREPQELKPDGPGRYTTVTHSSLIISNGKWNWNHGGVGGVSALDYLTKVRGVDFVAAVESLCGERAADYPPITPQAQPPPEKPQFYPPKPLRYANGVVTYLQERGIHPDIISRCLREGILCESRYYNPKSAYHNAAVCAFMGKDAAGEIRFAAMRGIDTDLKQDKSGSDKEYNFCYPAESPNNRQLAVFEAPIDALSHATLALRGELEYGGHRLSLGGTSPVSLTAYLTRNPQIEHVALCLDNDDSGRTATQKIQIMLAADERFSHIKTAIQAPWIGKDFNDVLLHAIQLEREHNPHCRLDNGAAHFL